MIEDVEYPSEIIEVESPIESGVHDSHDFETLLKHLFKESLKNVERDRKGLAHEPGEKNYCLSLYLITHLQSQ